MAEKLNEMGMRPVEQLLMIARDVFVWGMENAARVGANSKELTDRMDGEFEKYDLSGPERSVIELQVMAMMEVGGLIYDNIMADIYAEKSGGAQWRKESAH